MTTTASGSGAAAALAVAFRIIGAADTLRMRGAAPQRALRITLGEGDEGDEGKVPRDVDALARAIWAVAIGSDGSGPGGAAILERLSRILACAETLCSFGVEPLEAINVLRWVHAPCELEALARDAWAYAVRSGAVVRPSWSASVAPDGSGPGAAAVIDALSRILTLAERLRTSGADPREAIDVLRWVDLPPGLAAAARAAWAFAVGLDDDGEAGAA